MFMVELCYFWWIVIFFDIWKEFGWNMIIYLAVIILINFEFYEAVIVDGVGRFRKMINIIFFGIMLIVIVFFILSIGNIINIGFER